MPDQPAPPLFDPARLLAAMDVVGCDAIVAHSRRNYFYLSGVDVLDYVIDPDTPNFVLVPRDPLRPAALTIPMSEYLQLQAVPTWLPERILCGSFYVKNSPPPVGGRAANAWEGLVEALRSRGLTESRVAFELEHLPVTLYRQLAATFPRLQLLDASSLLRQVRQVKTPEEVRRIRVACEITEQAIGEALSSLQAGQTDTDLSQAVAAGIVTRGAEVVYVQVGTGATAGLGLPMQRTIQTGDVIRLDVAAVYQGYNSDLGRGCAVGRANAEQQRLYHVAYEALQAGLAAVQVGQPVAEIFHAAMNVWREAGFPEVQRHHVGHGLGLQAHEAPLIKPTTEEPIAPGMVLAVEVPCYVYEVGGFAPEDIVVVGPTANTQFTHAPRELPVVG